MIWINSLTERYLLLAAVVLLLTFLWFKHHFKRKLPPGPFWRLPFLGNLREFTRHEDIRITLRKFKEKYGEVYSLYLGMDLVVIVTGLDAVRDLLVKKGDVFSYRPDTFLQEYRTKGRGLITSNGHHWKTTRKFSFNTLRSFGFGKRSFESRIQKEIATTISEFEKNGDQPFDPRFILLTSFCNVICSIIFGTNYAHDDLEFQHFLGIVDKLFELSGQTGILNFLSILRFLPGDMFKLKEYIKKDEEMKEFVYKRIDECKRNYDDDNIEDFMSAFLKEMKTSNSEEEAGYFKDFDLNIITGDLMGAGTETAASTTRWGILYLINNPEIQDRVASEIDEHVGKTRLPCMADRENLVYTEAFVMEAQRMANLTIVSIARSTVSDVSFRGYTIPKGAVILPDFDSILTSKDVWENPDELKPERFIGADGKVFRPDGFIPFSAGRRNCFGEQLARMELFLFMSSLVQKFKFLPPLGEQLDIEELDGVFGVTHTPKPFKIRAIPRL